MAEDLHATDRPGHDSAVAHHQPDDHGGDHGHDDHAHGDEALGPLDPFAWGAGILGVGVAIAIAACFAVATSGIG